MTRVKLKCIMGCAGLKSRYREKGLFTTTRTSIVRVLYSQ